MQYEKARSSALSPLGLSHCCLFVLFLFIVLFSVQNTTKPRLLYSGWTGSSLLRCLSVIIGRCEFLEVLEVFEENRIRESNLCSAAAWNMYIRNENAVLGK